jgi:hypothetical protein
MKSKGIFKVYFDLQGNLLHRAYGWQINQGNFKEEDNHVFSDKMEYDDYGGSHIYFKSVVTGRKYHMFLSDFHAMMKMKKMQDNIIEGEFTFTKKGRVLGFKMILPPKP